MSFTDLRSALLRATKGARAISEAKPAEMPRKDLSVLRLKRRADFLRAAAGDRLHARAFSLQATPLPSVTLQEAEASAVVAAPARFGITVTKRIGGAVERNRIKRRFKEALRLSGGLPARPGRDYVIIAKLEALTMEFAALRTELSSAIGRIDRPTRPRPPKPKSSRR